MAVNPTPSEFVASLLGNAGWVLTAFRDTRVKMWTLPGTDAQAYVGDFIVHFYPDEDSPKVRLRIADLPAIRAHLESLRRLALAPGADGGGVR